MTLRMRYEFLFAILCFVHCLSARSLLFFTILLNIQWQLAVEFNRRAACALRSCRLEVWRTVERSAGGIYICAH